MPGATCPSHAERMANCDRATVRIKQIVGDAQFVTAVKNLDRKSLVAASRMFEEIAGKEVDPEEPAISQAFKDLLATGERGLSEKHILAAVVEETRENEELATISNPDEWARVNGRSRGERVTMVRPLGRGDIAVTAPEPRARGVQEWNDVVPEGIL